MFDLRTLDLSLFGCLQFLPPHPDILEALHLDSYMCSWCFFMKSLRVPLVGAQRPRPSDVLVWKKRDRRDSCDATDGHPSKVLNGDLGEL